MRIVTCEKCRLIIPESDKSWDLASQFNICPNCKSLLSNSVSCASTAKTKNYLFFAHSKRRVFITFAFFGPLIGAVPFLLISPTAHKDGFIIIIFAYLIGIIPASLAGLIFNSLMPSYSKSKRYQELLYGALSGLLGVLPILVIFGSTKSLMLLIVIALIGVISGGICGHVSKP
ncbi:hypothetical protein [Methylophilus sp. TWE2]|uniref:hypothetical protein n=1 Tax=Methylophilus sp. TWE2 TaxID=1662285 RepID=UPI0012E090CE|nr:hypothetical protein [Methylophilus sp. TWE2]